MHVFLLKPSKIVNDPLAPRAGALHDAIKILKPIANDIAANRNVNTSKADTLVIDPNLKKANGNVVTLNDIPDSMTFGNGVTALQSGMRLVNGERVPVIIVVFEDAIGITLAQLRSTEALV